MSAVDRFKKGSEERRVLENEIYVIAPKTHPAAALLAAIDARDDRIAELEVTAIQYRAADSTRRDQNDRLRSDLEAARAVIEAARESKQHNDGMTRREGFPLSHESQELGHALHAWDERERSKT